MKVIAITGASGFIGQHLVHWLSTCPDVQIRALVHRTSDHSMFAQRNVVQVGGDLLNPESLAGLFVPGCTVVNLAYLWSRTKSANIFALQGLIDACISAGAKRLIHCSTAAVVGQVPDNVIDEETACNPIDVYGRTKLELEQVVWAGSRDRLAAVILRPTEVFGLGGAALQKLAKSLLYGHSVLNFLRSSLFGHRRMHLVSVQNVVAALAFLIEAETHVNNQTFFISDDQNPMNNFHDVEKIFMTIFGRTNYLLPRIPLPSCLLAQALRLLRRPNYNPFCVYDSRKIRSFGLDTISSFEDHLASFAGWFLKEHGKGLV